MKKKAKSTEQGFELAHLINVKQSPDGSKEFWEQKQDSLAARLKAGDRAAAAELVDIYYKQIYWFMRRLGHNSYVSEDLTQESFLQAWNRISQLRDGKALNGWLYRIAGNVSKLHWRRHKGREVTGIEGIDGIDSSEADSVEIVYDEQLEQLKNAVARLPIKLGQAVVLHYMQHLTIAEAAEAANIRQGTFKSRLSRALKALRKQVV